MPRYRLTIEYDGTPFVGWQRQTNGYTVQEAIEDALARFVRSTPALMAAGRTDAGVHATAQVIQIDMDDEFEPDKLAGAINYHLRPHPVSILDVSMPSEGWHARFSATGRRYLYRILDRRGPPVVDRNRVWHVSVPLDVDAMHDAAQVLVGHHDFTTFRAKHCQARSPEKTLDVLSVSRVGAEIHVVAAARSFLHHQVRSMVGTLKMVGEGNWTKADVKAALEARDRQALGLNAPPQGLYLTDVIYGD